MTQRETTGATAGLRMSGATAGLGTTAAGAETAISVEGIVKRYGQLTAVNNISFTVRKGETFGLLGPNGAGKTTTLEIIEGLRKPDEGRVVVLGVDVAAEPRRARALMGIQLQEAGLFDRLTVAETIRLFSTFHRKSLPVDTLIRRLQLEEKAKARVDTLSGGQRQRLSIALALVNDPEVVILDEPTTGLDPQARRHLWEIIRSIRDEGRTIVLTTHYMEEAEALCDRVAIVDHGELIALDTPGSLIQRYAPGVKVFVAPAEGQSAGTAAAADAAHDAAAGAAAGSAGAADGDAAADAGAASGRDAWTGALRSLPGVHNVVAGFDEDETVVYTNDFEETIDALLKAGKAGRIRYRSLRVEASNLEDVFLTLTGRRLRE